MRIHTSLDPAEIYGMIADLPAVTFERFDVKGSRSHPRAVDIILSGTSTRRHNGGNRGAGDEYAATWDEWGIFLGRVFRADPNAKATYYADRADFERKTGGRFGEDFTAADQHRNHKWEWNGRTYDNSARACRCGAEMSWT